MKPRKHMPDRTDILKPKPRIPSYRRKRTELPLTNEEKAKVAKLRAQADSLYKAGHIDKAMILFNKARAIENTVRKQEAKKKHWENKYSLIETVQFNPYIEDVDNTIKLVNITRGLWMTLLNGEITRTMHGVKIGIIDTTQNKNLPNYNLYSSSTLGNYVYEMSLTKSRKQYAYFLQMIDQFSNYLQSISSQNGLSDQGGLTRIWKEGDVQVDFGFDAVSPDTTSIIDIPPINTTAFIEPVSSDVAVTNPQLAMQTLKYVRRSIDRVAIKPKQIGSVRGGEHKRK